MSNNIPLEKCIPLGDRVVVRRDDKIDKTDGGILLANAARRITGTVISVGPGEYRNGVLVPVDAAIKPGVRVVLTGYAGMELSEGVDQQDEEYLILRADDIQAWLPQ